MNQNYIRIGGNFECQHCERNLALLRDVVALSITNVSDIDMRRTLVKSENLR